MNIEQILKNEMLTLTKGSILSTVEVMGNSS